MVPREPGAAGCVLIGGEVASGVSATLTLNYKVIVMSTSCLRKNLGEAVAGTADDTQACRDSACDVRRRPVSG